MFNPQQEAGKPRYSSQKCEVLGQKSREIPLMLSNRGIFEGKFYSINMRVFICLCGQHYDEIVRKPLRIFEDRKFSKEFEHEMCQKVPCEMKAKHEVVIDV